MATSEPRMSARSFARIELFSPRPLDYRRPSRTAPRLRFLPAFVILTQIALGFAGGVVAQAPKTAGALTPPVYVVHISVDGLRPEYLQQLLTAGQAPNFARLKAEGAWTFNARTDYDITVTLPNHVSMLTGRPINNKYGITNSGHRWTLNSTPPPGATLHTNAGYYVASAFDVAHDNGYSTALYASKDKFVLFRDSYNATNGALDVTGANNGRQKIDVYVNNDQNSTAMFSTFLTNMTASPTNYTFLHFTDPDTAGHAGGWGSAAYMATLTNIDAKLGQLFGLIAGSPLMAGNTTIILGADHGGVAYDHSNATLWENYVIEMMLWGPSIPANTDLYTLNGTLTTNPGATGRPDYALGSGQPIRNGDGGNCALRRLGLTATIPGSSINNLVNACQVVTLPATPTPVPPTATPSNTPIPPTATPVPPTATPSNTPVPPTATPVPPTATPSNTPVLPTATPVPPTATPSNTPVLPTATPTSTPVPPTATPTNTSILPTPTPTPLPTGLPSGWTAVAIGSPGLAGSTVFDGSTWTISGGGTDIWGTSDKFRYTYQTASGDMTIIARVTSVQNTNEWAKAGVMFRNGTAANAKFAMVIARPDGQVAFQWRTSTGGSASWTGTLAGGTAKPKWVKLTRSGNVFRAYYSTATGTPTSWTQVGNGVTVTMATPKVGLAVTSHNNSVVCAATFTNVSVSGGVMSKTFPDVPAPLLWDSGN